MPILRWIGKEKVINQHLDVPCKVLEHSNSFDNGKESKNETNSGNKIIHGDNLEALKALIPKNDGKIECAWLTPTIKLITKRKYYQRFLSAVKLTIS